MGKSKWLAGAMAALFGISAAHAADRGRMYITPFVGYAHLRIDSGRVYNVAETLRFDSLQFGATVGYLAPFGLLVEAGRSAAIHVDLLDDYRDYSLTQTYGAVGWQVDFAEHWHLTPRVGRGRWKLASDHRVLFDDAGVRSHNIDGWANFWEVGLMRDVNSWLSLGVNFKDANQQFGHSRAGEFMVRFAF
jgi:hypothetical protein